MAAPLSLIEIKKEHFEPLLGQMFRFENQMGYIDLQLVEVKGLPQFTLPNAHREHFSLLFRDDHGRWIPPLTYNLRHPRLGLLEGLLVTPVMPPLNAIQPGQIGGPTYFEIGFG